MRITGNDPDGQAQLGNFIDPEAKYPVLVTTSRLVSTGVDAQTCRLIVLDREVGSMTEFKQKASWPRYCGDEPLSIAADHHCADSGAGGADPASLDDLLAAHGVLMAGLMDDAGRFRTGGVASIGVRR